MGTRPAASNTQVHIRPAVLEDAPGIAALLVALGYPCGAEEAEVRLMHLRDEPEQQLWIAEEHGSEGVAKITKHRVPGYMRFHVLLG